MDADIQNKPGRIDHGPIYYKSRSDVITIVPFFDVHMGAKGCQEDLLRRHVKRVADNPNAYWIGGGDMIDAIVSKDEKRFNLDMYPRWIYEALTKGHSDVVQMQIDRWLSIFKPIAHKCLGLLCGNHEVSMHKYHGRDVYDNIVTEMARAKYNTKSNAELMQAKKNLDLGYTGFLRWTWRRGTPESFGNSWQFTVWLHHGYVSGGRSSGDGKYVNAMQKQMYMVDADLFLMGHAHVGVQTSVKIEGFDGTTTRLGYFMPSYYGTAPKQEKSVITYADMRGYPAPKHLGVTPIMVRPDTKFVWSVFGSTMGHVADKAA